MKSLIRLARQKKSISITDIYKLTHTSTHTYVKNKKLSILQHKPKKKK